MIDTTDALLVESVATELLVVDASGALLVFDRTVPTPVQVPASQPVVVRDEAPTTQLLVDNSQPQLVQAGFKGDAGPAGAAAGTLQLVAATALDYPRIVAVANGTAYYPDLTNPYDILRIVGVTTHAAAAGAAVTVAAQQTFNEPLWNWLPGPIYCSAAGGQLTQTPAYSAVIEVGKAVDANTVSILIHRAILRA